MIKTDCIYFKEKDEDTGMNCCTRSSILDGEGNLCNNCRLWDSYIPQNASKANIERALVWQNAPLDTQPDYFEYFIM